MVPEKFFKKIVRNCQGNFWETGRGNYETLSRDIWQGLRKQKQ